MSWLKSLRAIVGSLEGCGTNSRNARQILFALLEKYCAAAKICTRAKIAEVVKLTWPRKITIRIPIIYLATKRFIIAKTRWKI